MRCDVSIIIPAYNEEADIGACLEAIRKQKTKLSYEIIVSDNRSTDATRDIASEFADKIVISSRRSIAIARNAGGRQAKGSHLLFLDADSVLPKTYIEQAHKKFSDHKLLAFNGRFKFLPRTKRGKLVEQVMDKYFRIISKVGKVHMLGCNTNVRKSVFEEVGGYRDVPIEDVEFGMRVHDIGKTKYFPDLFVYTSARRLENMGLVGTAIYYLKLELKLRYPKLADFAKIENYSPAYLSSFEAKEYEEITFNSKINSYINKRLAELNEIMDDFNITRLQMKRKIKSTVKSLSYIPFTPRRSEEYVDKAIELLKEKYKKLK